MKKPSFTRHSLISAAASLVAVTVAQAAGVSQTYDDANVSLNTWNTTDTNWDVSTALWTNDNDAIFAGTGEAVTVTAVNAHNIAINSTGYSFTGGTLTLTGTTPTITAGADTSIASTIAGSAGLAKAGTGVLTLSGTANTYTGTTAITGGVLATATLAANGTNSGIGAGTDLSLDGGTFRYTGGSFGSDLGAKFNRNINVGTNGGTFDVGGSGFLFYSGTLTGSGTLKVIDSSGDVNNRQLLLTSNNPAFTGNIEIGNGSANSGWIQYRSAAASPFGTGTITLNTGGILSSDGGSGTPASVSNNITLNGGTLGSQGVGTNYTGQITAATGTTSSLKTISSAANVVIGGTLLGTGTIQKDGGSWSVELRGNNGGFTGTYNHTADGATIFYTAASASAAACRNIPSGSNGAARFMAAAANGTYQLGALAGTTGRIENLGAGSGTSIFEIGALNTDTSFAGTIQNGGGGTVGITKVGTGTLTLSGAQTATGITTVSAGQLKYQVSGDISTPTINNNSTVTFYRNNNAGTRVLSKLTGTGTWTVDGPGGGDQWSNRVILRGTGSDNTGTISVINSGKLWCELTGTNNPIGDTANVDLAATALFNLYGTVGSKETIGALTGSGTMNFSDGGGGKALTLEVGGGDKSGTFTGTIQNTGTSNGPTALSISKTGTGTQVLDGPNTYSGTTTVNAGTLELGFAGSLTFFPGANGIVNGIGGTGSLDLKGIFNINLANADLTDGNSWLIVDVNNLTESYTEDFAVSGFSEISPGVWEKLDGDNTWTFTNSTGVLELAVVASGYTAWTNTQFPGETNVAIIGPDADPDADGIDNGIEFVIGGDPSDSPSTHLLPTATVDADSMNFVFLRTDAASGYNPYVEYSTSLAAGSWTKALPGEDDIIISEEDNIDGNGTARVTVELPKALAAPGTKLFARLRVDIP